MTKLLEQAIKAAEALPPEMQDELARDLLERVAGKTAALAANADDAAVRQATLKVMANYDETLKALAK